MEEDFLRVVVVDLFLLAESSSSISSIRVGDSGTIVLTFILVVLRVFLFSSREASSSLYS